MINWSNRIDLSDSVASLISENLLESMVDFVYMHKSGRENSRKMRLDEAIQLAESRMSDKRYKNYSIYICS